MTPMQVVPPQTTSPRLDLPCIAFHNLDRSTVLFSMSEDKRVVHGDADEVLKNKIICPTAQGLLLVRDPGITATFLWNPSRGDDDKVQLPPLLGVDDVVLMDGHCLLSDKLAAPGCVVILVEAWRDSTAVWYCRPGDDLWEKYEYDIGSQVLPSPDRIEPEVEKKVICPIAACQGKFYFNSTATELGVLDFSRHEPTLAAVAIDGTVTADGSFGCDDSHPGMVYLVESGCDLYMVRLLFVPGSGDGIDGFSVHKMDFLEKRWRNVRDLGARAFFLSEFYFGASCSGVQHGLLPDRVYFVCDRNNTLQVFDVQDGSCEVRKLDQAPHARHAFWLLPKNP